MQLPQMAPLSEPPKVMAASRHRQGLGWTAASRRGSALPSSGLNSRMVGAITIVLVALSSCCCLLRQAQAQPQDQIDFLQHFEQQLGRQLPYWARTFDDDGYITKIDLDLTFSPPSGTVSFPTDIGNLVRLSYLSLVYCKLSGSIPDQLWRLPLTFLSLRSNSLSGGISMAVGFAGQLEHLELWGNLLEGPLPVQLGSLTRLTQLNLWNNRLYGFIPTELGSLTRLQYLDLSSNMLRGTIPAEIARLPQLIGLDLGFNWLTGSIPADVWKLTGLKQLIFRSNSLQGSIPPDVSRLVSLTLLWLESNFFSGILPAELSLLLNLQSLRAFNNTIGGSIPAGLGGLTGLVDLRLHQNFITGSIPPEIGRLPKLYQLFLNNNLLTGNIPASLGSLPALWDLQLNDNSLTGAIPSSLGNVATLRTLNIQNNQLTGSFPTTFLKLTALRTLNADDTIACPPSYTLCPGKPASNTTPFCTIRCTSFCSTCMEAYPPPSPPSPPPIVKRPPPPKPKSSPPPKPPPPTRKPPPPKSPPPIRKSPPPSPPPPPPLNKPPPLRKPPPPRKAPPPRRPPPRSPPPPPPAVRTYGFNASSTPTTRNLNRNVFRHASIGYNYALNNWRIDSSTDWTSFTNRLGAPVAPVVRDQSSCSACWAFAAVGVVSSAAAIAFTAQFQVVPNLSVQQVVSCATTSSGCRSGMPASALDYIAEYTRTSSSAGGLFPDSCFKYQFSSVACQLPTPTTLCKPSAYGVSMWEQVDFNGWFGLLLTVQQQPAVVTLYAACAAFLSYSSGIFQDPSGMCDGIPNHAVLVVGYVLNSGVPYWIIQNSWGTGWGIGGRMRIAITGSYGLCNMHLGPALYPVMKLSDPCFSDFNFNPCGSGKCTTTGPGSNTCECQDPFVSVTNVDGRTQSCIPKAVCSFFMFNPCALGTCVNDGLGGYSCICPPGFRVSKHATDNSDTCIADTASQPRQYSVASAGVSCAALASAYGLSVDQLVKQNSQLQPPLTCKEPYIAINTVVNVTQPTAVGTCTVLYTWSQDDNCEVVSDRFMLGGIRNLETLNPWLNCIDGPFPHPGMQICVQKGTLPATLPNCTAYYSVKNDDTCETIQSQYSINVFRFYALNPGINCDRLQGTASSDVGDVYSNQQVCLSAPISQGICKAGSTARPIMAGDTCMNLLSRFFTSLKSMADWNYGLRCTPRLLYLQKRLCVPNPTSTRSPPPIAKARMLSDLREL